MAKTIVNMEQSYVTAAFFRHRTAERYKAMMQAQQTAKLLGEGVLAAVTEHHDLRKHCIQGFSPCSPLSHDEWPLCCLLSACSTLLTWPSPCQSASSSGCACVPRRQGGGSRLGL